MGELILYDGQDHAAVSPLVTDFVGRLSTSPVRGILRPIAVLTACVVEYRRLGNERQLVRMRYEYARQRLDSQLEAHRVSLGILANEHRSEMADRRAGRELLLNAQKDISRAYREERHPELRYLALQMMQAHSVDAARILRENRTDLIRLSDAFTFPEIDQWGSSSSSKKLGR